MVESKTIVSRLAKVAIMIVLIASALMCFLPLMNVFALSLSSNTAALAGEVMLWPVDFTFDSYEYVADRAAF